MTAELDYDAVCPGCNQPIGDHTIRGYRDCLEWELVVEAGFLEAVAQDIAETYAREPGFYGATYCVRCQRHLPVGRDGEFVWDDAFLSRVGT